MNTTEMHIPSNKVRDIERYCHSELDSLYGIDEVCMFLRMLFEAFLGWDHVKLLTSKEQTINQSDLLRFHQAVEDLKEYRPIQHIIGYTDFCGCRINVDSSVLIPRPETEEIVEKTVNRLHSNPPKRILDLCTGSGCIAIALAKQWPGAEVTAVDISEKALGKARENGLRNNVKINWQQMDVLSIHKPAFLNHFDLIVSNPPYIMELEKREMRRNVKDWEPSEALFVPDEDPLVFYSAIAKIAKKNLTKEGIIVLEINENLGIETCKLLESEGFTAKIEKDFRRKERCVLGEWA